jgi:ribosome-associated protein
MDSMKGPAADEAAHGPDDVPIRDQMIRLGQLLKLAALAEDGIQAKEFIENGLVQVNGVIEERRGRQVHPGDTVTVNGRSVTVVQH